jgi:hypothetical protein
MSGFMVSEKRTDDGEEGGHNSFVVAGDYIEYAAGDEGGAGAGGGNFLEIESDLDFLRLAEAKHQPVYISGSSEEEEEEGDDSFVVADDFVEYEDHNGGEEEEEAANEAAVDVRDDVVAELDGEMRRLGVGNEHNNSRVNVVGVTPPPSYESAEHFSPSCLGWGSPPQYRPEDAHVLARQVSAWTPQRDEATASTPLACPAHSSPTETALAMTVATASIASKATAVKSEARDYAENMQEEPGMELARLGPEVVEAHARAPSVEKSPEGEDEGEVKMQYNELIRGANEAKRTQDYGKALTLYWRANGLRKNANSSKLEEKIEALRRKCVKHDLGPCRSSPHPEFPFSFPS